MCTTVMFHDKQIDKQKVNAYILPFSFSFAFEIYRGI